MFSLPYPASALGEPTLRIRLPLGLYPHHSVSPQHWISSVVHLFWMLRSMQSTRSPSNWSYFKRLGLSFRGALSVSLCLDQCGPSPCPTEAGPDHVSSAPSPHTWLGPVLQETETEVRFYLPALPDSFRGKEEPPRSWRPLSTCPVCRLPRFPCGCSLGLPLPCWSSLEPTLFLSPFAPLFLPSSSSSFYWFSTLFLRDTLQSHGSCCSWNLAIPCGDGSTAWLLFSFWLVNFVF